MTHADPDQVARAEAIDFLVVAGRAQDQFEIADDDGQEIVEIVRHAAGQLADSLEPLRLGELFPRACELGVALLRDRQRLIETAIQAAGLDQ